MTPNPQVEEAAALLGTKPVGWVRLHGGDLSDVTRVTGTDGKTFIMKSGSCARTEAEMLRALKASGTPAPAVLAVTDQVLVLEDLGTDEGPASAWNDLGRVLKNLHATRENTYGWPRDHAFGPVAIPNAPAPTWPAFWAERRLLPCCSYCFPGLARRIEGVANRLPSLLPAHPPASLLHGDLWTGNIMARNGRIAGLIDPACYHGHAEVDLAMLTLFGSPSPDFWNAYGELEPGFPQRRAIYQLWPALVHLRLFGRGYFDLVERCLQTAEQ